MLCALVNQIANPCARTIVDKVTMNGIIRRYAIATPFIVPKKTLTINIRLQPKKTFSVATIIVAPTTAEAETTV